MVAGDGGRERGGDSWGKCHLPCRRGPAGHPCRAVQLPSICGRARGDRSQALIFRYCKMIIEKTPHQRTVMRHCTIPILTASSAFVALIACNGAALAQGKLEAHYGMTFA